MSGTGLPQSEAAHGLTTALSTIHELRGRIDALTRAKREGIAVVGIGCRLPGGVTSPGSFWQLLVDGVDAVVPVPSSRWDVDSYYDPDPATPGRMPLRYGAFLDDVDQFDPYFFGISPREAARMDPQQRILLEVAWEALEDAGQTRDGLRGSATGVFVGANSSDYLQLQLADRDGIDPYTVVGSANSIIANRLSYLFDLRGPSLTVDTACSSSLVAVHLACQSLRNQECATVVAGGANVMLSPITTMAHAKGLPLAPDGRCKTFDARADGYTRGEGVAVIVLKRLSDAVAARDRIWAVIKGSAVNQDGLTNGLTAPNGRSQRAVITSALDNARIAASQVTLIEAHGTGTALGDPIEVESLAEVYGEMSADSDACALGSVKTNIGHLEAGAGIVGLIKTILSIHHGAITPHLHLESVNPHITLDGNRLFIPTSLQPWDVPDEHRHGAVSSFGAGGTNAHVILGPAARDVATPPTPGEAHLIPISARTDQALRAMVRAHRDHLRSPEGQAAPLRDIAYTATFRRTHHEHRCAVVARSHTEAADRLTAWLQGEAPTGVVAGRPSSGVGDGVVFVFPGQGSQRAGMGRELMRCCPAFRAAVMECDQAMRQWLGRSVIDEIHGIDDDAQLDRIDVIQPALFALAVGLAARWRSFGIEPDVVVGHSMGEVAAAHVAGALSLDDATRIICRRSSLLRRVSGTGAMLVVALPLEEADRLLDGYRGRVSLAVSNSPTSTVLSGDPALLTELGETLQRRNVFCRPVKVDVASHSPQMDLLRDELLDALSGLSPIRSTVPILSTVTGELCDGATFDAEYWVRNLREPVLFWSAIQSLIKQGNGAFVEMSPHPILLSAVEQGFELTGREGLVLPAMRRDDPEAHGVLETVGALHTHGIPARWDALRRSDARPVVLPGYVWQHESFWFRGAVAGTAPIPAPRGAVIPPSGGGESELLRRLRPADTRERREILFATVLDVVSGVLGFDGARVDSRAGFFQLGMDSLMAAQVRIRLDAALQRKLPSTVMFEHSTVESLSRHLADLPIVGSEPVDSASGQRQSSVAAVPVSEHHRPRQDVAELIDGLSEDELLAVLAAEVRNSNPEAASA